MILIFTIKSFQLNAQNNFNLIAGIGNPELMHIGARFQSNQIQMGGSVGISGKSDYAVIGEFLFHFGKFQDLSTRKSWYARLGSSYLKEEDEYEIIKSFNIHTRVGRELIIKENLGIGIDAGLGFRIFKEKTEIKPKTGFFNINIDFLEYFIPAVGIHIYYTI